MKKIVVLTGAGISAESGLKTFRDSDGLWNNYSIYEVATPEAWKVNPQLVLDFYNQRRKELETVKPNAAHKALAKLESQFDVTVITQNVDNLHERGGSKNVLHLHGQLTQVRGEFSPNEIIELGANAIYLGERNSKGEQLRPNIVWFGEDVPMFENAVEICQSTDILLIIGTSLNVYPAAGLLEIVPLDCQVFLVDPRAEEIYTSRKCLTIIKKKAGTAVPALVENLLES